MSRTRAASHAVEAGPIHGAPDPRTSARGQPIAVHDACGATISSTRRFTARTTVIAASSRAAGLSSSTPRTWLVSVWKRISGWISSATLNPRPGGPNASKWSPTTFPGAAPRPTTRDERPGADPRHGRRQQSASFQIAHHHDRTDAKPRPAAIERPKRSLAKRRAGLQEASQTAAPPCSIQHAAHRP